MSSSSITDSVAGRISFDTKFQDSAFLSSTLADIDTNNTSGDINHQSGPALTADQIKAIKKTIRSYFHSAPTTDSREILTAKKIWLAIDTNGEKVSRAGQVSQKEARHHNPLPNNGRAQFAEMKGIFVDPGWSEQGSTVELNGSEGVWEYLQVADSGREYYVTSIRVTASLHETLNGVSAQCVTIEFSGMLSKTRSG